MPEDKEDKSAKDEVAAGFKSILERIADFFDIFDLSFLVAGSTTLSALSFWGWRAGLILPVAASGWMFGVGVLIACYVLGLFCFTIGRWIRIGMRYHRAQTNFSRWFKSALAGHGLEERQTNAVYLNRDSKLRGDWRLYVRFWAEIRQVPSLMPSFTLLCRYWVMAATYDGLAIAVLIWIAVLNACAFGFGVANTLDKWIVIPTSIVLVLCFLACSYEAGRYFEYQVEEVVACIAARQEISNRSSTSENT